MVNTLVSQTRRQVEHRRIGEGKQPNPPLTPDEQKNVDKYKESHNGEAPKNFGEAASTLYDKTPGANGQPRDVSPDSVAKPRKAERDERAEKQVDEEQKTPALRKGEGYFQALRRMHPDWDGGKVNKEAHRIKEANGGRTNLHAGERFDTMTPEQRKEAIAKRSDELGKKEGDGAKEGEDKKEKPAEQEKPKTKHTEKTNPGGTKTEHEEKRTGTIPKPLPERMAR